MKMRYLFLSSGIAFLLVLTPGLRGAETDRVAMEMMRAAENFLAALDDEQVAAATFAIGDEERENWHFVPTEREGLSVKEMSPAQRDLAHVLLSSGMTNTGYAKAVTIMTLEHILWEMENESPKRDPEKYFVAIFGEPAMEGVWGWRFEGHHLSLNFTVADGRVVSVTPSFMGANPDHVKQGPRRGLRVLGREAGIARKLFESLDEGQRERATIAEVAPKDIITAQEGEVEHLGHAGLPVSEFNAEQKAVLKALIREYVLRHRSRVADYDLEAIEEAGLEKIHFAWSGGSKPGEGFYYRVQGPTFLFEYCNTQNDANHSHAVWRNFDGDFGRDVLGEHVAKHHSDQRRGALVGDQGAQGASAGSTAVRRRVVSPR
jgi:hypothetical protein